MSALHTLKKLALILAMIWCGVIVLATVLVAIKSAAVSPSRDVHLLAYLAGLVVSTFWMGSILGREDAERDRRQWGAAKIEELMAQRDTAWHELREIRRAIDANPEEATIDEVRAMVARLHELESREQEA